MAAIETDRQDEIIAFLSRPESYGASGPVQCIETHAAIVFLVADRAYKLKRAVYYSYLDFSSAEKRRIVCESEFALNRRTAPDLYLEVRSVNRLGSGALGFGPGEPVDWLVVMRRFESGSRLDAVADRGELGPSLVRSLADSIAQFHEQAQPHLVPDGALRVRAVIDGNRASMDALPEMLPARDVAALHAHSLKALDQVSQLLDQRGRAGHVRRCHGDLHLANICLWHGHPTLYDCLEFSEELARIDVLYDLAFLLMDLWQRGHRAQASQLFNRYLDMRDEGRGVAAIALFLSMRAAVRAHVSAAAAMLGTADHARSQRRALDYLASASDFLRQEPPRLVAIGGLSGTGKSTLAQAIAPALSNAPGARLLRSDIIRKRIMGIAPEVRLGARAYTRARTTRVYRALTVGARTMLTSGRTTIADAVFANPGEREAIERVASDLGVAFTGLWLDAPPTILHARVDRRADDASDATSAIVDRQLDYEIGPLGQWYRLDSSGDREDMVRQAMRIIASPAA